ncbi:MAG: BEM46 family [Lasallia pustulata]|uniref:BEM46 family n=1 Tax=Lasallia pustulata TaxID=136370 RepID=A0A5M8PJ07_9LECA|nr:MAG: BEM46 family [Lasallia pustulata]
MAAVFLSYLRLPVLVSSGLAALASGLLYFKQNELIYPRNIPVGSRTGAGVPRPSQFGITDFEELQIPTPDGETLSAFLIRPSNKGLSKNVTILMFHGNAGNIGHRVPIARVLEENIGCTVLMLEYRGYGLSSGTPNEEGIRIDAQTGLDYIRQQEETKRSKIVVYGQSLGGAVSIQLVAKNQEAKDIAGLVLENTFTTIRKLIPSAFPPAKYLAPLCHQYWPSEDILPQITEIPILFLSGLKDEIVPPSHMRKLYSVCRAETKIWKEMPNGTHNDTVAEPHYFNHIAEFIRDHVLKESRNKGS